MTRTLPVALLFGTVFSIVSLASSSVQAHAVLSAPVPRDQRDDHKDPNGPCGIAATASQTRTPLTAGASYTVTFKETITHPGCWVVDFAATGDTNFQVLGKKTHANPPAPTNPTKSNPRNWSIGITVPSTPCTSCTLRLRQIMNDGAGDITDAQCPPATVASGKTYYTCANISIAGGGGGGSTGAGGSGGAAGGAGGGTTGNAGTGGYAGQGGTTGSAGSSGTAGNGTAGSSATGEGGSTGAAGTTGAAGSSPTGAAGTGSPTGTAGTSATGTAGTTGGGGSVNPPDDSGGCAVAGGGAGSGGLLGLFGLLLLSRRARRRSRS